MVWDDEIKAVLARIDERTINIERRLKSGDDKMTGFDFKFQELPCKATQEKIKMHDRLIWGVIVGIASLFVKSLWGVITK